MSVGRKKLVPKGKFTVAYRKAKSAPELAEKLGIAIPTVYKFITRYNLKNYARERKLITDKEILDVLKEHTSLNPAARELDIPPTSLRQRCYRLGISFTVNRKVNNKKLAFKFIKEYWVKTVIDIAKSAKMEPRQVRFMMQKYSIDFCVENKVPIITKLTDLKIANEIMNNKSLRKDRKALAEVTGHSVDYIKEYLRGGK